MEKQMEAIKQDGEELERQRKLRVVREQFSHFGPPPMDDATIFTVLSTQADWDVEKGTALLVKVQDFNQTAFRTKALAAAKKEKMLSNRVEVEKQIEQLFADMDVAQLRKILEDAEGDPVPQYTTFLFL